MRSIIANVSSKLTPARFVWVAAVLLLAGLVVAAWQSGSGNAREGRSRDDSDRLSRPKFQVTLGKVRPALPYRIVSFHRGKADKKLIRLAAQLGFNGVQIQLEGSTVDGIKKFAERDAKEHLVDFCHKLGMSVTVWVHEMSDFPAAWMPEWLGTPTPDNQAVWSMLDARYEWVLHDALPNIDGLSLTVVETQINATDTAVMVKLVNLLNDKCRKYNKSLMVRTFVWYPEEFANVMGAVSKLPRDMVIMSKCVPQDWQMRGAYAAEIGNVGGRPQIIEYDVAGEYFLRDRVANCMPELLKRHFDYGLKHGVSGICVRVDRGDSSVLHEPSEVNLWALGMLAAGATNNVDDIWNAWAVNRFGAAAAPGVVQALKLTQDVVAELLSIGSFTFGDTRGFPPLGDEDVFGQNWQNWWWDQSYVPLREKAEVGDKDFTREVQSAKLRALQEADLGLMNLELVRDKLSREDYQILRTKLMTNKVQLEFRAPMAMAVLHYRRMIATQDQKERDAMDKAMQEDLAQLRSVALPIYEPGQEITYLDKKWRVGVPEDVPRDAIYRWAYQMDLLRLGEDPRPTRRGDPSTRRSNEIGVMAN